jgi:hypothetical protein
MILRKHVFFFFYISTQEGEGGFELVTSALLSVVPADWATSWGHIRNIYMREAKDTIGASTSWESSRSMALLYLGIIKDWLAFSFFDTIYLFIIIILRVYAHNFLFLFFVYIYTN